MALCLLIRMCTEVLKDDFEGYVPCVAIGGLPGNAWGFGPQQHIPAAVLRPDGIEALRRAFMRQQFFGAGLCRAPDLSQFVVSLKHSSEMVVFEAAKCLCSLKAVSSKDLTPAILGMHGLRWRLPPRVSHLSPIASRFRRCSKFTAPERVRHWVGHVYCFVR